MGHDFLAKDGEWRSHMDWDYKILEYIKNGVQFNMFWEISERGQNKENI